MMKKVICQLSTEQLFYASLILVLVFESFI